MKKGLVIFLFSISWQFIFATTYYVSPHGNNANPGTLTKPWATPGYASQRLKPGDTLIILGGKYILSQYPDDIIRPSSGTASAWIKICGEPGKRPMLLGQDNLLTAIDLSGVKYIRLENLEICHNSAARGEEVFFRDGIEILGAPAEHIILKDLYIHHLDEFGINIQDIFDLKIEDCRIEYCGFGALGGPAGEKGGWQNVNIQNCRLTWSGHYYQGTDGKTRPYDRPDGFGIEQSKGPIWIEDCYVAHNYGDGIDSKAHHTTINRCIVANNSCDGVKLWGDQSRIINTLIYGRGDGDDRETPWSAIVIAPEKQPNAKFEIINVTVDDWVGKNYLMHVQYDYPDVPAQVILRNNIFSSRGPNAPIFIGRASTLLAENNLFFFPKNEFILNHGEKSFNRQTISSLGKNNIYGDPLFKKPTWGGDGDYSLTQGSPAIDVGTNTGAPELDLLKRTRRLPIDLGALEY